MQHNRVWKLGVIFLAVLLLGGCLMAVGSAIGVGAYKWAEATMENDFPRKMEPTYRACVDASQAMKLTLKKESYSPTRSSILASTTGGTNVTIELFARPHDITTVKVRFGFIGDKDQSAYFLRTVSKKLGV